jgi:hypothetical protein
MHQGILRALLSPALPLLPRCAGGAISEHQKLLAEAGMIIRDPPAMHLLLSELVRQLHRCVAGAQLPRDNQQVGPGAAGAGLQACLALCCWVLRAATGCSALRLIMHPCLM